MSSAYDPPPTTSDTDSRRPLSELLTDMTGELTTLFRQEVTLAKAEVREEASKAGKAAGMLAGAAVAALIGGIILAIALGWLLDRFMPTDLAFFLVAVVLFAAAAVAAQTGRKRLQAVNPTPERTVETLKEDAQTLKERRA